MLFLKNQPDSAQYLADFFIGFYSMILYSWRSKSGTFCSEFMKRFFLLFWIGTFFMLVSDGLAQSPANKDGPDHYADSAIIHSLKAQLIENSFLLKSLGAELITKREKVKQEKLSWLSSFRIGLQFFSLDQGSEATDPTRVGILPSLGASLQLDLQGLATLNSKVRSAKADVSRMENERKRQEQILGIWIQEKYMQYVEALEVMKLQLQVMQSLQEKAELVKRQFESGEGKLEDFLLIENAMSQTKESMIKTKIGMEKVYMEIQTMIASN
jgi:outer membrane protein TolC